MSPVFSQSIARAGPVEIGRQVQKWKHAAHHQHQPPVQPGQHDKYSDQSEQIAEHQDQARGQHLVQHFHIVHLAGDHFADRVLVKKPERHFVQVGEDLGAQVVHHALTDVLHGDVLQELAKERPGQHRQVDQGEGVQSLIMGHLDVIVDRNLGQVRSGQVENGHAEQQSDGSHDQGPIRLEVTENALEQGGIVIALLEAFSQ